MTIKILSLPVLCFSASFALFSQTTSNIQQPISINADGAAPNASAILDVKATDKGMLVPRMTSAQRTAIASPATGLLVFDTDAGSFWFYNGTAWSNLSVQKQIADADGDTKIQVEKNPDEDVIRFEAGGAEFMTLKQGKLGINLSNPESPLEVFSYSIYSYGITPIIKIKDNLKTWNIGLGSDDRFSIASENFMERFIIHKSTGNICVGENTPSHRLVVKSDDVNTVRLIGPFSNLGIGAKLNFGDDDFVYIDEPSDDILRFQAARVGVGRIPNTNMFEVEGEASKSSAGDWLANSDARLKKNISPLDSRQMLEKLLALQGVAYEWNDDQTGSERPEGIQYGFTAQNIQTVFPTLVEEDKLGYLQTAYGTYDAMTVEAIRALHQEIGNLKLEIARLTIGQEKLKEVEADNASLKAQLDRITAALAGAGIVVEK